MLYVRSYKVDVSSYMLNIRYYILGLSNFPKDSHHSCDSNHASMMGRTPYGNVFFNPPYPTALKANIRFYFMRYKDSEMRVPA